MRWRLPASILLATSLLASPVAGVAETEPAEGLSRLKEELKAAQKEQDELPDDAPEARQQAAADRYLEKAAGLARRALALAETRPEAPGAAEVVAWVLDPGLCAYSAKSEIECDKAYDLIAERYLDEDAILPVVRWAWSHASQTAHSGAFLRAAMERSTNPKVKALACFSLGRHQERVAGLARALDDPIRGKLVETRLGPENFRRIRAIDPDAARQEAEALFERTLKEFADLRPMGADLPSLGEQAEGLLFQLRNLSIGRVVPEIEGEDVDGEPLKLSDFRGKVVVLSFWATWCGPCMDIVPAERALVGRMKGRPFALIGVNGDENLAEAKAVSAKEGVTWRSFRDGGPFGPISLKWGIRAWPAVFLVDAKGVIRNTNLIGEDLDKAVDALVNEVEAAAK